MIVGANSKKPWSDMDRLIMEAYQITEDERCPQCHNFRWLCHSESEDIRFALREDHCAATAKVEQRNADDSAKKGYVKPFGSVWAIDAYSPTGTPFIEFREPYYKDLLAKQKIIAESRLES